MTNNINRTGNLPPMSLRDQVEQTIASAIISGETAPGTVLSVPTLAARFHVSATPVREAVLNLEKRGFVAAMKNKGFRVTEVDQDQLNQLVQVRRYLEPQGMYELAPVFDPALSPTYREHADRIVIGARYENLDAYLAADQDFHLGLLALIGNPLLVSIVRDLRERTRLVGLRNLLHSDELAASADEHHAILDRLEAHDAEGVRELMTQHIEHIAGWWSGKEEQ